ncbi:DUF2844 domain-containing protein [Ramlibacter sp.]|uniref:DUF2844 domain-containing protein n=1 Tax=Ramlibacter sp. TaxID=1917967 RepID=UPI002602E409|nr:DUF2844 domain-containing protein [Ramlibacter sp.]MDB5958130.1 hypothetical protein [Ramlibacter sp.]
MKRIILVGLLLATRLALAALADQPMDATTTTPVQKTAATTSAGVAYTDISRTLRNKTQVHEFANAAGTVFAVSWSGPFKADLKQLLGRHFQEFQKSQGQRSGNRSHERVDTGDMVVVSSGHMGAFEGRAWLPSQLPAGFDPEEMK